MIDYKKISYLKDGTKIQRRSYDILDKLGIMDYLADYKPLLTGTIPIGIDIEGSDLDIVCEVKDFDEFEERIRLKYGNSEKYRAVIGTDNIVINFHSDEMEIEIYGQDKPSRDGNAYRHMLVEARLLEEGGEDFRGKIVRLKKQGIKTEPAFCKLLGVEGDPYENMLNLEKMTEAMMKYRDLFRGRRS